MVINHTVTPQTTLYSTLSERQKHTPNYGRVDWPSGLRGEGLCIPKSQKIKQELEACGLPGICYHLSIADFSPTCIIRLTDLDLTTKRWKNFALCNNLCAKEWNKLCFEGRNDWTASSVKKWIRQNKYTWHECNDMQSCELVPRIIHSYFNHLGGIAELKRKYHMLKNIHNLFT